MYNKTECEALIKNFNIALKTLKDCLEYIDDTEEDEIELDCLKDDLQGALELFTKVKSGGYTF